jgi:hypothetical protein
VLSHCAQARVVNTLICISVVSFRYGRDYRVVTFGSADLVAEEQER